MADLLVDTDIFIDHLRGVWELSAGRHRLHYSVITRAELVVGNSATESVQTGSGRPALGPDDDLPIYEEA